MTALPALPSFRVALCVPVLAAALLGACAKSPHQDIQNSYRQDAHTCRSQNPKTTQARIDAGTVTDQKQVVGIDTAGYLRCMEKLGYRQDVKTDPLLKAMQRCERQATTPRAVTASGARIDTRLDPAAYAACMKERGFGSEVTLSPAGRP